MWVNGSLGYYYGITSGIAAPDLVVKKPTKNAHNTCSSPDKLDNSSIPSRRANLTDLLAPAVEGPPSPQSLRQLNNQMKRASYLRHRQGHRAAGSSVSSTASLHGELEHALDNMDLVRRSSFDSTDSSNRSKDIAEGLQAFGKSLFHRRGRSKQESVSSSSSLYSADTPTDSPSAGPKESVIPKLFSRRKPSRDDPTLKRPPISGPFNFQHVAHTNRDSTLVDLPPPNGFRGRPRAPSGPDFRYSNVLAEPVDELGGFNDIPAPRPGLVARHTSGFNGVRRFIKSGRSADLNTPEPSHQQSPPLRPPRPPFDSRISRHAGPPVPARGSSRLLPETVTLDAVVTTTLDRPLTSSGFQRPRPFSPISPSSPASPTGELQSPTLHAFTPPADVDTFSADGILSRSMSATPEQAWPLASPTIVNFENPLPELPDEETQARRSRLSRASNNSSLRGSHSVPALRKLAQSHRKMSNLHDPEQPRTKQWATQSTEEMGTSQGNSGNLGIASWEDDIDYCYEHEVEADCDYQWDRPSMDVMRDVGYGNSVYVSPTDHGLAKAQASHAPRHSPGMLSASGFEVPALSPASQASTVLGHEAITPITNQSSGSFSPTQRDRSEKQMPKLKRVGNISCTSTFRESRDFTLSPSLLIPRDFNRELQLTEEECASRERGRLSASEQDEELLDGKSSNLLQQRTSTATTESSFTSNTDSTGERHTSTNSSWTALTRHTASTSSLHKLSMPWTETPEPVPRLSSAGKVEDETDEELTPPASEDTVPELVSPKSTSGRKALHKSHASESVIRSDATILDAQQLARPKRPRARTASLSKQPPPVGQYALFPRSQIQAHGDRI